jgi:hypothetical protein
MRDREVLISINSGKGQITIRGSGEANGNSGPHAGAEAMFSFGDPENSAIVRFLFTGSVKPPMPHDSFAARKGKPLT